MVEEYDPLEVADNAQTEILKKPTPEDNDNILASGKWVFKDRKVVRHIRINDNTIEEKYNYYYEDELFYTGDWSHIDAVVLKDDGETVRVGRTKPDEFHVEDWAEGYAAHALELEVTEVWEDVRRRTKDEPDLI